MKNLTACNQSEIQQNTGDMWYDYVTNAGVIYCLKYLHFHDLTIIT